MKETVYFDFDGTLVDCKSRLYGLFSELIAPRRIAESRYWSLRMKGLHQKELLRTQFGLDDRACEEFASKWLVAIEEEKWLLRDIPQPQAAETLQVIASDYDVVLLTCRQSQTALLNELEHLGWTKYFDRILVTEQRTTKEDLIRRDHAAYGVLIGDTCEDIHTAQSLSMPVIAVRSDLEPWEQVMSCSPTAQTERLTKLPALLRDIFIRHKEKGNVRLDDPAF